MEQDLAIPLTQTQTFYLPPGPFRGPQFFCVSVVLSSIQDMFRLFRSADRLSVKGFPWNGRPFLT